MKRLAGMVSLVAAGAVASAHIGDQTKHIADPGILVYITAVYTIGIAVMLWYTRQWSWIGCGLLATMTGDALVYGRLSQILPMMDEPWGLDIARAAFVVGGTYLLFGLILWVRSQSENEDDTVLLTENVP